jgi:peptidoglycan/xylan/chitin deacetylase (PgdA/CDA1 family)
MTTPLKTALCALYKYSGLARAQEALARRARRSCQAVLLFHRVTDAVPEDDLTVSVARFQRLCRLLRERFHVVPLAEVFRLARAGGPLPPRTVAVTFDDCYRDNLFAARLLARYGLPATFFIPTAFVGTNRVFPWDKGLPPLANLTWDDLREMVRLGFEIGSHTVTHADLGTLTAEQVRWELVASRAVLEEQLDQPVRWLAYPFGGVDNFRPEWLPLAAAAGYEGCLSGHGGLLDAGTDPSLLPRVPVPAFNGSPTLELYLRGCLRWFHALKARLGLLVPYLGPGAVPGAPATAAPSRVRIRV